MNPFFIIASPRSGSTLLRLMLSCHPELCVPQEAGFLITLFKKYSGFSGREEELNSFLYDLQRSQKFENWKLSEKQLQRGITERTPLNYSELIAAVYETYIDVWQPGKKIWGDKNNFFLKRIDLLNSLFPSAKFIHLVRDGRDVACSYRGLSKVREEHSPKFSSDLSDAALVWRNNVRLISENFALLNEKRTLVIHYEELVREPAKILEEICTFLEVAFDQEMLNYHSEKYVHHFEPVSFDKWKKLNKSSVTQSQVGRWKREMFSDNVFLYQKLAGKWLEKYGYEIKETDFSFLNLFKNVLKAKLK